MNWGVLTLFPFSLVKPNDSPSRNDRWFQQFVAIRGTRVLAQYLLYLSSKGKQRFVSYFYRHFARSTVLKDGSRPSAGIRDSSLY
jgi:hypothetical protein